MADILLPIPFLVLSTKVIPRGEVEVHVLTPFGDIDLTVDGIFNGPAGVPLEVRIGEGVACWTAAGPTVPPFRETLAQFVDGMVRDMLGGSMADIGPVVIRFPQDPEDGPAPICS